MWSVPLSDWRKTTNVSFHDWISNCSDWQLQKKNLHLLDSHRSRRNKKKVFSQFHSWRDMTGHVMQALVIYRRILWAVTGEEEAVSMTCRPGRLRHCNMIPGGQTFSLVLYRVLIQVHKIGGEVSRIRHFTPPSLDSELWRAVTGTWMHAWHRKAL